MFETYKITWDVYGDLVIRDVDVSWKARALAYLHEHFFANDVFYQMLSDETGDLKMVYKEYFQKIIQGEVCVIVINEKLDQVCGVALCKWMTKDWYSWTDLKHTLPSGTLLNRMLDVSQDLIKDSAKQHPKHLFDSLHLFEYLIHSDLRYDEVFMDKFFNALCGVARNLKLPRVTTVARIQFEKDEALSHGFKEINKLIYSMYIIEKKRPFDCLRDNDEMSCSLMEKLVEPIVPYYDIEVHEITFPEYKEIKV